ncbi:hypothetical protein NQ317_012282 [Molorchus minor]|uniref:J domain-containing protein n=1 Tax=Molorchus minor TaxID=1323400 RepID=A0ABQ9K2K9_9CUCU|nr:hypothetical protein NQ317_012282 [Molorchus minor]
MSAFKNICEIYFGSNNFYEILKVKATASAITIRKAYHKLSLLVHPDRVTDDQKEAATEKFKVLGKIHSILQDKKKRKLYDDFGICDEIFDLSFNWLGYRLFMFKKISINDIRKYEKSYIGSSIERRDIKHAYLISKGNMDIIVKLVPFSNCQSEPRIVRVVRQMVAKGEVPNFRAFFHESWAKRARRHKKWERERKETESISIADIEQKIDSSFKQRGKRFEKNGDGGQSGHLRDPDRGVPRAFHFEEYSHARRRDYNKVLTRVLTSYVS